MRRVSGRRSLSLVAIRTAIVLADWLRGSVFPVLLVMTGVASGAVWFSSSTSAHQRVLKSWERLFGVPENTKSGVPSWTEAAGTVSGYSVTTFDAPGSGTGAATGTLGFTIDAKGDIAGTFIDNNLVAHGFLRAADGTFTEFDAPGAGTSAMQGTFAIDIDPSGSYIAGMYEDSTNAYHSFLRAANGTITAFDAGPFNIHEGTVA
jgi:hypothetical protein